MTIPTTVIMKMATIGLSEEQAQAVADMLTAVEAATKRDAETVVDAAREKGRDRWRRWKEKQETNVSKREPTLANDSQRLTRVEDKTLTTEIEPQVKKVRACRLPTDFSPDLVWAQGQGLSPSQAQTEAAKFRDYWSSKGSNATKTDWPATWRNWVRQSVERLPRGSPHQRPPTAADLAADLLRQMEQPDASTASEIEGHSTSLVRFPRVASG